MTLELEVQIDQWKALNRPVIAYIYSYHYILQKRSPNNRHIHILYIIGE